MRSSSSGWAEPVTVDQVPAVEGWFDPSGEAPALLGSRCLRCGTVAFPRETLSCRNPCCPAGPEDQEETRLSRRGRIWSYTDARYQPPPPYVPADPYVPFALAAVELAEERLVVLGQMVPGVTVDDLAVGDEVELVVDTLYDHDEREHLIWKWRPVAAPRTVAP